MNEGLNLPQRTQVSGCEGDRGEAGPSHWLLTGLGEVLQIKAPAAGRQLNDLELEATSHSEPRKSIVRDCVGVKQDPITWTPGNAAGQESQGCRGVGGEAHFSGVVEGDDG